MLGTRITAVLASVTVAGLLVVALVALQGDDQDPLPRGPAAVTPAGPSSPAASPERDAVLDDLPRGPAPTIGYVEDHVYVAPDGTR